MWQSHWHTQVWQHSNMRVCAAEHVKSEVGVKAEKEIRSQDSDDWTLVETASDAGADAEPQHQASKA
jgi:hypothetical protein